MVEHFDVNKNINTVIQGDCIPLLKKMKKNSINHIVTDIPYDVVNREGGIRNMDKGDADILTFDLTKFIYLCSKIVKDNFLIFCSTEQITGISKIMKKKGFKDVSIGIWEKTNPSPVLGQYFWLSGVECCVVGQKNPDASLSNPLWRTPIGRSKFHPTEKQEKLMDQIIDRFTSPGDIILDPCAGSGSTLYSAKKAGRNYIGIELNQGFYEHIKSKDL